MAAGSQTFNVAAANNIQDVLREYYVPTLADTVYAQTVLLDRLRKKQGELVGKHLVWPIRATRNWGTGPRPEVSVNTGAVLPPAGSQGYDRGVLLPAHYYAKFAITGPAIDASKSNMAAMIDVLDREMTGLRKDLAKHINRDLYGDGTGSLATLTNSPSSTTTFTVNSVRNLEINMPIVVAALADGSSAVAATITGINETTKTVTVGSNVTGTASTYGVFPQGTHGSTVSSVANNALDGLQLVIDDAGTYAGINRATAGNEFWKANTLDGSGGLTHDLLRQAMYDAHRKGNGEISLFVTTHAQWQALGNLTQPDRRWQSNVKKLDGAWKSIEFDGIPVVYDVDCPEGKMFCLDESTLELCEQTPLGFVDDDGLLMRWAGEGADGIDQWEVAAKYRVNLKCDNPAANTVIEDLPV